jgi:hypothetical protein
MGPISRPQYPHALINVPAAALNSIATARTSSLKSPHAEWHEDRRRHMLDLAAQYQPPPIRSRRNHQTNTSKSCPLFPQVPIRAAKYLRVCFVPRAEVATSYDNPACDRSGTAYCAELFA